MDKKMIISDNSKEFKIAPAGLHMARLYSIIDLGHQSVEWAGEAKIMHKVVFTWELHGNDDSDQPLKTDDGKPLIVSKRYTVSLGDQARLRQDLEAWSNKKMTAEDRKNFDLKNLLGKFCMVNITHSEDGKYANISGISPVPSALRNAQPDGINAPLHFWLAEFDQAKYDNLPKYYKEKITESSEWRGQKAREANEPKQDFSDIDDAIPF
jgi:hypothetical protein